MKRHFITVAILLLLAVPASGQGWSMTAWFIQTIAIQANRLDLIKAAQPDPPVRGAIDQVWLWTASTNELMLGINGWGFECGQFDIHAVDVRLNVYITDGTTLIQRHSRPDVAGNSGLSAWCPSIPLYSGIHMDVPLGQLLPGTYYLRLRLWTANGESYETNITPISVQ